MCARRFTRHEHYLKIDKESFKLMYEDYPEGPRRGVTQILGVQRLDWRDLLFRVSGLDIRVCPACMKLALVRTALPAPRSRAPPVAA